MELLLTFDKLNVEESNDDKGKKEATIFVQEF
ncbi:hypothetical protein LMOSLCC2376_0648 [Listeria monocytogenes SLCC2376]|nr:hypothetical protein LMOSLCC2376_0648 [Listeria monocytogenes SLCC2376]